jgi:alkyl sulfatase BDS1-like metallo-beta-lactamase superfamily hydrolase
MSDVLERAEQLWTGQITVETHHPLGSGAGALTEIADGVRFWHAFSNSTVVDTANGLFMVDSGDPLLGPTLHDRVREWRPGTALHTAVFSHGHIDHVFGIGPFDAEATDRGWQRPTVLAQEAMPARFDRYRLTGGYNAVVNRRQFGFDELTWPADYRYPDEVYRGERVLELGEDRIELHATRGETDDHTWTWLPGRRVLCCGDLFIWASPNAGNPQKVQRYAAEWAAALRDMAAVGAEVLLPGHGVPVFGADRVRQALTDTAEFLQSLHDQTIALMNEGATLDAILHTVRPPAHLADRPYLQPVYDEPEFVVRNVWRLYGGWWDGNPASLKPAPDADVAAEVVAMAGGDVVRRRITELLRERDDRSLRLAGHLAQWLAVAEPTAESESLRAEVYATRRDIERSTMSKGVFGWAAREPTSLLLPRRDPAS